MFDLIFSGLLCIGCLPPPPPPCNFGMPFAFHTSAYWGPVGTDISVVGNNISASTVAYSLVDAHFDNNAPAMEALWTRSNLTHCNVSFSIDVDINPTLFTQSADVEIEEVINPPVAFGEDPCGRWLRPGDLTPTKILIFIGTPGCSSQAVTAGHEYGHELGFADQYSLSGGALHGDTSDIMAFGFAVHGYHARVLRDENL